MNTIPVPHPELPVGGRLQYFLQEWLQITDNPEIIDMITGMHIDLVEFPLQNNIPNPLHFSPEETIAANELISQFEKNRP